MLQNREDMEARLTKIRAKEKAQRERYLKGDQKYKKRKTDAAKLDGQDADNEEQFVLEDYDSDMEQFDSRKGGGAGSGLSAATLELMEKLGMNINGPKEEDVEAEDEMKVSDHIKSFELQCLSLADILLLSNPLPTHTIHQRASKSQLPTIHPLR